MDIYHHKWPQKAIVIPRGEAPRVTMKLFEVTSGGKFPLYPSDDYINGIVYAEKTPVKSIPMQGLNLVNVKKFVKLQRQWG